MQREIDAVRSEGAAGDLVRATPYTQQILKEALRLYPPAYGVSRYTADGDVVDGTEVLPGSNIFVGTFGMHRSPQVWPDPERFDPERFASDQVARRHRMAWLPFGGGAHVCIGAQLATAELTVALTELLGEFSIRPAGTGEPVPPVASGLVLRPGAPMPHRLVARQHRSVR